MAKNNKNIIPRPAQKIYIIAALLFFAALALQPLVYIIDATFRSTPFESIEWIYKSLAFNLVPLGFFGIAYWLTSNLHDRTWRMTIALLYSQLFLGIKEAINQVIYALFYAKNLAPVYYDSANLIVVGLSVLLLFVTLLVVKRRGNMSENTRLPLMLLIGTYSVYTFIFILVCALVGIKLTIEDLIPYLMTFIQLIIVFCFLIATYLLQPSSRRHSLRLTRTLFYVLIPILAYTALSSLDRVSTVIFQALNYQAVSRFYIILVIIVVIVVYPGVVLWARHKKAL